MTPQPTTTLFSDLPNHSSAQISDVEYEAFRKIVYDHSRINLGANKKELVNARITRRLIATKINGFRAYLDFIQSDTGDEEFTHFIDAISTNHTFFFRESAHYEFLNTEVFPKYFDDTLNWGRQMRVWSAAASTGEEPYSIAMTLADAFANHPSKDWRIEGTDISSQVLRTASDAVYKKERVQDIEHPRLKRYFQKGNGSKEGLLRVRSEIRNKIQFHKLNLLQPSYPFKESFHIIFNRNVMIYFDRETQEELIAKMTPLLVPGGYLIIGHAETLSGLNHPLKMIRPSIYQK